MTFYFSTKLGFSQSIVKVGVWNQNFELDSAGTEKNCHPEITISYISRYTSCIGE